METLVNEIIAKELDSTRDMFVDAPHPAAEVTSYLIDMALCHHSEFQFIHSIWEEEVFPNKFPVSLQKLTVLKGLDESQWLIWQAHIQCELLTYDDGEVVYEQFRIALEQNPSPTAMAVDCILSVLGGDPSTAILRYQSACRPLDSANELQLMSGLSAFFYALAMLKKGTQPNTAAELGEFTSRYGAAFPQDQIVAWLETLHGFACVSDNKTSVDQLGWLVDNYRNASPWVVLLRSVCMHWLRLKPTAAMINSLEKHLKKAITAGVYWYVSQARYLIAKYGEQSLVNDIDFDDSWLCNYIAPAQNWQVQLRQFEAIVGSSKQRQLSRATTDKQRLIWCVADAWDSLTLEPRLQKLAKNGRWSKGRRLSLSELTDKNSTVSPLVTSHVAELITSLVNDTYTRYGYLESKAPIRIAKAELFELVANLTDLYRIDEQHHTKLLAMNISVLKPSLEIIQEPGTDAIIIRLVPYFGSNRIPTRSWIFEWVTQDKLQITVYSREQVDLASALGEDGLHIPAEGKERVLASLQNLVPMINVLTDVGAEGLPDIKEVLPDGVLHIELSPTQGGLLTALKFYPFGSAGLSVVPGEGHTVLLATIDDEVCKAVRDCPHELEQANELIKKTPLAGLDSHDNEFEWVIEDPEQSLELLASLQELADEVVISWPEGQKITLPRPVYSDQMSVKLSGKQDWLQLDGELQVNESQVLKMDVLLRLMDTSATGRFITLDDGSMLALSNRLKSQLTALRGASDNGKVHALASAVIDEATDQMAVTGSAEWTRRLKRLSEARSLEPELPDGLNVQLRDYQLEGYKWIMRLAHWGAGACLADDMGLGKTIQAMAVIMARAALGPALVVAPTSVCNNWIDEFRRFSSSLNIKVLGSGDRQKMISTCSKGDVLICSYGLLQNEIDTMAQYQWSTVIADEAQAFKNASTRRSKAMMLLQADCRVITTGTPIENHLGELWNLFRFINPGLLGSLERFNERFASPIEIHKNDHARQQLKALVKPFILRRLKKDVLTELPSRTEITQLVEFDEHEAAFYEAIRRQSLEKISAEGAQPDQRFRILAEITRLRQACCHPKLVVDNPPVSSAKLRAFSNIITELRQNNHRCLVFSQFVGHLTLLREYLDENQISYQYLDGSTPVKKRKHAVDSFQNGEGEVFLISLKAGGSGLNLTAANYVIHMDPWWNPAVEDQASDRAHRMGQTKPVTIYRLVVKDTIEEKIVALHANKRDLADGLLEGTDSGVRLSVDDLIQLIDSDT